MQRSLLVSLLTLTALLGIQPALAGTSDHAVPVQVAYQPDLRSSQIESHLVGQVIQQQLNLPVHYVAIKPDAMWRRLAHDQLDISVSAWLQSVDSPDYHRWWTQVTDLGTNVPHTRIGLVVPSSSRIHSIADLKGQAARFNHQILVVPNGTGAARRARQAIAAYGLDDFSVKTVSTETLRKKLAQARHQQRDIVAASWAPSRIEIGEHLHWLRDRKAVFETNGQITTIVSNGLLQRHPEVYHLMHRYYLGRPALKQMMHAVDRGSSVEQAVRAWRQAHADTVAGWLKHE